ncbi:MAG TPA: ABC-type transport auxiliary lipoprotein family protein [Geminicoccaceae bacterium]|nr:ABC-type transport auxiliary lipoprotein family protein [Geminicoccaceae bacterium]
MRRTRRAMLRAGLGAGLLASLAACQLPGSRPPPREFRLTPKTTFDELPRVAWSLVIARPETSPAIDTTRIAVVRTGVEIEYYADARWVDRPSAMLQPILVQSFRNSGAIAVVGGDRAPFRPDFVLNTEIVTFYALHAEGSQPQARVDIASTLIQMPRRNVVGSTEIGRTVPAAGGDLNAVTAAFDDALGKVIKRIVEWTLTTGQQAYTS